MRKSGILMHISSLPSPYGIGTMGRAAREFVDFLQESGQSVWQLLPICPTGYGDSPYQSCCTYAGNPYFIDLDELKDWGLLKKTEYVDIDWEGTPDAVNYGALYEKRYPILRKAAERFLQLIGPGCVDGSYALGMAREYQAFCGKNGFWLSDYAMFMARKAGAKTERTREAEMIKVYQFFFWKQWWSLKAYANKRGIAILGDLPIYVPLDSVDVWAHPEFFQLDENKMPREVAGVPPDGFTAEGQLWGNPLYDWEYMEQDGFAWWVNRIRYLCDVYDMLRIDHFRGFESYYAIPYGETTAKNGRWKKGPGIKLFRAVEEKIGKQNIIAEDLGYLTEAVHELLRETGFPGMKVLEFAFDSRESSGSTYLPHHYERNCVAYPGTHDNNTILGWLSELSPEDAAYARKYLRLGDDEENSQICWNVIGALWGSVADLTVVQMQDVLGLGSEARMNTPSTLGKNWKWRMKPGALTHALAEKLREITDLYGR